MHISIYDNGITSESTFRSEFEDTMGDESQISANISFHMMDQRVK